MMKKLIGIALAICMVVPFAAGCGKKDEQPQTTTTPAPTVEQTGRDPLNGSETISDYKPVISMIDNSAAARPQRGIQAADIVYECEVEGGITRLMGVWNSNIPDIIGPVRSARQYFAALASEYDTVYCHFGGPHESGDKLNVYDYMEKHNLFQARCDGLSDTNAYFRDSKRKAPHNAYLYPEKALEKVTYTPTPRVFHFDPSVALGNTAETVSLKFGGQIVYTYDSETKTYKRSVAGKEHKDADTGKVVEVKNLIFQFANYHTENVKGQLADLAGKSGKMVYMIEGKYAEGTWSKESEKAPTVYKDANGNEIVLQPGNTWIHVVPTGTDLTVK